MNRLICLLGFLLSFPVGISYARSTFGLDTATSGAGVGIINNNAAATASALSRLPEEWQQVSRRFLVLSDTERESLDKLSDDELQGHILRILSRKQGAEGFVISHLAGLRSARYKSSIMSMMREDDARWQQQKGVGAALEQIALFDTDDATALTALETRRVVVVANMGTLLEQRIRAAERRGASTAEMEVLLQAEERWMTLARGVMLPKFLREPGAAFPVKVRDDAVRAVVFGDFGTGKEDQFRTAAAIRAHAVRHPYSFGITVGDNFYSIGLDSPTHDRWVREWDVPYGPLGIPFYASLGNHDWYDFDSPAAQILHTRNSPSWRLPAPYYTYTAGAAQFFVIDTNILSRAQLIWLDRVLSESKAKWKIVYGHEPIYSASSEYSSSSVLIEKLVPLMEGRVDIYMAGHHHSMQHLQKHGIDLFIVGSGGSGTYSVDASKNDALFALQAHGFAVLEYDSKKIKLDFIGDNGKTLYSTSRTKAE